jgi:hypothetical protein
VLENEPTQQTQYKQSKAPVATQECPLCPTKLSRDQRAPQYNNGRWMVTKRENESTTLVVATLHRLSEETMNQRDWEHLRYALEFCRSDAIGIADPLLLRCGSSHTESCPIEHLHFKVISARTAREGDPVLRL